MKKRVRQEFPALPDRSDGSAPLHREPERPPFPQALVAAHLAWYSERGVRT